MHRRLAGGYSHSMKIAIIGGGPAGLRAAEIAAEGGCAVTLFEAKASVGRKFLVAGRGGLNLAKAEPSFRSAQRYTGTGMSSAFWSALIAAWDADDVREWAARLGVETFAASTGRLYPREMKAAPLLRRWVSRLRGLGVEFAVHHRCCGLRDGTPLGVEFEVGSAARVVEADAVILALGGASWPGTGSDGAWTAILARHGIGVAPLAAANCGWEVAWPAGVLATAEGHPLKNITVRAGDAEAQGELLITHYGLEGGAIYQLGAALRAMPEPRITIDFKPTLSAPSLARRLAGSRLRPLIGRDF